MQRRRDVYLQPFFDFGGRIEYPLCDESFLHHGKSFKCYGHGKRRRAVRFRNVFNLLCRLYAVGYAFRDHRGGWEQRHLHHYHYPHEWI